jgi:hypothetical protein
MLLSVSAMSVADGFGVFVWAVFLLQFYRRHEARQAWQWGTYYVDGGHGSVAASAAAAAQDVRPDFHGVLRVSPVTGRKEKHFPRLHRLGRYMVSAAVTGVLLMGAFSVMICSLNLQGTYMCARVRTSSTGVGAASLAVDF